MSLVDGARVLRGVLLDKSAGWLVAKTSRAVKGQREFNRMTMGITALLARSKARKCHAARRAMPPPFRRTPASR